MSAVSEAVARRMTLGYLADTYGLELDPDFASGVTVTSIADDVDSVAPGSLYVPAQSVDVKRLEEARARGAYAALVPPSMKHEDGPAQMPLLRARLTSRQLGDIASDIAGTPSNALAIFVVGSDDPKRSERYASCVADFLHMLGNPVGVVKSSGSTSLERELDLTYPLSILDVQQTLSVCAEDGAAAMVFALNDRTLKSDALTSVNVDVIGLDSARDAERHRRGFACWRRRRSGISVRAVGERGGARRVGWRRPGRPRTGAAAGGGLRLRGRRADPRRPCRRAIRPARGAGPVRLGPRQYP